MISVEVGTVIAGKYRFERPLARGGMGSVWVARHLQLEIDVAIKLMAPEYAASPEARMRFEREARASAQLRSPYVVHMYDYGATDEGTLFLAMELLQGEDLEARLRRVGRLTPAGAATLVDQVCKALECAHDAGLVHRDLKPANLFLARHGREETVKVLDFGIAKAMGPAMTSSATRTGTLLGSPHYMSPEQVRRSKEVDPRSDLWSLGVILFQCLTGRVPFAGEELGDVLVAICSDDIPVASQLAPDLGPEVDGFLARALTRNPGQRFQSARELAEAFASIVPATVAPVRAVSSPMLPSAAPITHVTGGGGPGLAAPAFPVSVSVPAATAPGLAAGLLPNSTLAPSGGTFAVPPRSSRLAAGVAALAGGAFLLAVAAFFLLHGSAPDSSAGTDGGTPASGVTAASGVPSSRDASSPSPLAPSGTPDGVPQPLPVSSASSTPAAASATPASNGASRRPSQPVPRSVPSPGTSRKQAHDPLDHR